MLHRWLSHTPVWAVAIAAAAIFVAASMLVTRMPMMHVMNTINAPISVAIAVSYSPVWWRALQKPAMRLDGFEALALGIAGSAAIDVATRIYSILWNVYAAPDWMSQSYALPFMLWFNAIFGLLFITSPGVVNGRVPTRNLLWAGMTAGAITLLLILSFWLDLYQLGPLARVW